jgi:hypothetical protein
MNTTSTPIEAGWKISQVLETYPALLDTLVELTPAFSKLRNPIMRRVQSRLVTVGQAAGIAGIDAADLVRTLNAAAGLEIGEVDTPEMDVVQPVERPSWAGAAPVAVSLDARALLARGEEPFVAISKAVRSVPVGSVFQPLGGTRGGRLLAGGLPQGSRGWGG